MTTMMDTQTAAASLVEVAVEVARLTAADEAYGPEINQIWLFLRKRNDIQVYREKDDIYAILETVGLEHAVRMTGHMVEHVDNPSLGMFWRTAHEHVLGMIAAAEAEAQAE